MKKELTDHDYARRHRYRIKSGGDFVPGVTSIIDIIDKPGLKWGASEIGAITALLHSTRVRSIAKAHRETLLAAGGKAGQKKRILGHQGTDQDVFIHWCRGEFDREWKAKAKRGQRIHDHAQAWAEGKDATDIQPDEEKYMDALSRFFDLYNPKFLQVECIITNSKHRYGGRFDFIAELNGRDTSGIFMGDWKTGRQGFDLPIALQEIAYMNGRLAKFKANGSLDRPQDLPALDGARTVFLLGDGGVSVTDPFEKISMDVAWRGFLSCLSLYNITKSINETLEGVEA